MLEDKNNTAMDETWSLDYCHWMFYKKNVWMKKCSLYLLIVHW
jgi:hypothetical protein